MFKLDKTYMADDGRVFSPERISSDGQFAWYTWDDMDVRIHRKHAKEYTPHFELIEEAKGLVEDQNTLDILHLSNALRMKRAEAQALIAQAREGLDYNPHMEILKSQWAYKVLRFIGLAAAVTAGITLAQYISNS